MSETLYIAVDGGASGTRLALHDAAGALLAQAETRPTSLTLRGVAAWEDIVAASQDLLRRAKLAADDLGRCRMGLGLAGANNVALLTEFRGAAPAVAAVVVATDGYTASLGAHGGAAGAIVSVGTGTVGYRVDASGQAYQAGGWGFPIDDGGSGSWLGLHVMREVLWLLDGRDVKPAGGTALHRTIIDRCGPGRAELLGWMHAAPATRYAELAPLVLAAADGGDAAGQRLARSAGVEIERIALALDSSGTVRLCLVGGLAEPLAPYLPAALTGRLTPPVGDSLAGALMLAQGRAPAERLPNELTLPPKTP